jgi:hypothetical protein
MFGTISDLDRGMSKTCSSTTRLAKRAQLTSLKVCKVADQGKLPRGSFRQLLFWSELTSCIDLSRGDGFYVTSMFS